MTQAQTLANMHQKVRDLTLWYLSLLKEADPYRVFECNGEKFNSTYWLTAHLTWAQNFLVLQATGGSAVEAPWLDHYRLGCDGTLHESAPSMKDAIQLLKAVHVQAIAHIGSLTEEHLDKPNLLGFGFGGDNSNRMMIQHCIRHEAMHAGHLSWLCKINGIKSV